MAEAEDDAFKEVVAAHVPLIIYNSGGMDAAKRLGAMNYVGSDEYVAGVGGGEYFGSHGVKNVLCVNTLPGATNTEDRCKGVADGIAQAGRQIEPSCRCRRRASATPPRSPRRSRPTF